MAFSRYVSIRPKIPKWWKDFIRVKQFPLMIVRRTDHHYGPREIWIWYIQYCIYFIFLSATVFVWQPKDFCECVFWQDLFFFLARNLHRRLCAVEGGGVVRFRQEKYEMHMCLEYNHRVESYVIFNSAKIWYQRYINIFIYIVVVDPVNSSGRPSLGNWLINEGNQDLTIESSNLIYQTRRSYCV